MLTPSRINFHKTNTIVLYFRSLKNDTNTMQSKIKSVIQASIDVKAKILDDATMHHRIGGRLPCKW